MSHPTSLRLPDEVSVAAREAIAMMLDVDPADVGPIDVHVQDQGGAGVPA